jgi:hypothetical protein
MIVFSRSFEDHGRHLRAIFHRLQTYGILINPAKCVFRASEVTFLGYRVSSEGSRPLEDRVAHVQDSPPPKTASQLRRFLGMLNFCRRFLPQAAATQAPLHTSFPAPESKALIPLPGRRNFTRPSKSARQACHVPRYWLTPSQPRNLHSPQTPPFPPWVPCCSYVSTTPGSHWHSPRSSTWHSKNTAPTIGSYWLSARP